LRSDHQDRARVDGQPEVEEEDGRERVTQRVGQVPQAFRDSGGAENEPDHEHADGVETPRPSAIPAVPRARRCLTAQLSRLAAGPLSWSSQYSKPIWPRTHVRLDHGEGRVQVS
jgi:hypothetical protein